MRSTFDGQLKALNNAMITMGAQCEDAIAKAAKSFLENDKELAGKVPGIAERIEHSEREIESMCLKLLLMQQPVASDLRKISAALKMVTDLQRIGTQSADIAEIVLSCSFPDAMVAEVIHEMALATIKMVNDSIDAFLHADVEEARATIRYDDVVDGYFDEVKHKLIALLQSDPGTSEYAIDLLMITKYLERIGDHAVNIAKWVLFSILGDLDE